MSTIQTLVGDRWVYPNSDCTQKMPRMALPGSAVTLSSPCLKVVETWVKCQIATTLQAPFLALLTKYLESTIEFCQKSVKQYVQQTPLTQVQSTCKIMKALLCKHKVILFSPGNYVCFVSQPLRARPAMNPLVWRLCPPLNHICLLETTLVRRMLRR